jgi:hypothetical protein
MRIVKDDAPCTETPAKNPASAHDFASNLPMVSRPRHMTSKGTGRHNFTGYLAKWSISASQ